MALWAPTLLGGPQNYDFFGIFCKMAFKHPKGFMGGQNEVVITVSGEGNDTPSVSTAAKTLFSNGSIMLTSVVRLTPHRFFLNYDKNYKSSEFSKTFLL